MEKRNLINEHALNREPTPLSFPLAFSLNRVSIFVCLMAVGKT